MSDEKFNPYLLDDRPDELAEADPVIQSAKLKRTGGIWDITRELAGITYAGSGLKQEMVELEANMRSLLEERVYGYKYIEGFLLSMGYGLNKIRQTFRRLTGTDPQVYLDCQPVLDTPGSIPGQNYGWGKSKDKQYDYYFVMPHKVGFSVFGQKGDLLREEVKYLSCLDEAREFLAKKVSEPMIYDDVVDIKKLNKTDQQYLSEDFLPLGNKTATYEKMEKYLTQLGQHMQVHEKKAVLEDAFSKGDITEEEFQHLAVQFGILRIAAPDIDKTDKEGNPDIERIVTKDVLDEEDKLEKAPIKDILDEKTHMQFFEKHRDQKPGDHLPVLMEFIVDYLTNLDENLSNYSTTLRRLNYIKKDIMDRIEKTPKVGDEKAQEILSSSGTVSVILDVVDKTLPAESNLKQGLLIFSLVGDEVLTNDVFKGVDNKTYSLNEDGLDKYFFVDRQKAESAR